MEDVEGDVHSPGRMQREGSACLNGLDLLWWAAAGAGALLRWRVKHLGPARSEHALDKCRCVSVEAAGRLRPLVVHRAPNV